MLFIFDWDGTLSNSTGKITRAMQLAATDTGLPRPVDHAVHDIIGLGLPEALQKLFPGLQPSQFQGIRDAYSRHFLTMDDAASSEFFPGVLDTLDVLRKDGHLLTIATGKSRRGLDRILNHFGLNEFFDATRCADETASKPHPQMLEELLAEFDHPVDQAVMIGDTEYDMEMARVINMPRIAVSYGAHHIDRLTPYEPDLCIDHFSQLLRWHRLGV